jgi:predicted Zn-dependent protease
MYIYNALFQACKTEDELAAVMAHEFAHVYCRHVQQGENHQLAIQGTSTALGVAASAEGSQLGTAVGQLAPAALQLAGMGFTRHDEDEADEYGFKFYTVAGWDPNHFADFFKDMIAMGYDKTPEYQSDHPMLAVRVKNTQRRIGELPKSWSKYRKAPLADPSQFAQYKSKAAADCRSQPSDASLQKAKTLLASFSSCVSPSESQPEQITVRKAVARRKPQ